MSDKNEKSELYEAVMAAAVEEDGRRKLSCADAFRLADENGVELLDIARVCNRNDVRISRCQLGCFK